MCAALTITHSLVPPHPAPAAAAQLLGADMGKTMLYGALTSIPMAIIGGIVYGGWLSRAAVHSRAGDGRPRAGSGATEARAAVGAAGE